MINFIGNCFAVRVVFVLLASLGVAACGNNSSTVSVGSDGNAKVDMTAPAFLNTRAINQEALRLSVTLNGTPLAMVKSGDTWTGSGEVVQNGSASLSVEWNEAQADNTNLLLARFSEVATNVNSRVVFDVTANRYETEGAEYDADNDLISNLNERRQDSDPFDPTDPGMDEVSPTVKVPAVRRQAIIDGQFDSAIWANGQFQDVDDVELQIDSLIVDEQGGNVSDSVSYAWAALHDARYLSIFVFGRVTDASMPPSIDSGLEFWEDDSLEIFIDGDLSQFPDDYDKVDDLHIMIPLAINDEGTFADNSSDLGMSVKRIMRGTNVQEDVVFDVQDSDLVEFATCVCFGQQSTWEVRIDMVAAQIPVGKTFGFEVQINVDDNGGRRDTKWAWAARGRVPGDVNENTDVAWRYPVGFGLVQLLPFGGG